MCVCVCVCVCIDRRLGEIIRMKEGLEIHSDTACTSILSLLVV